MIYHLPSPISNISSNYSPYSTIIISTVNYRDTFFPKPDITRILGIPTYDALHQMQLELKTNALSVHSKLWGPTHKTIGLLMINTKYDTVSNVPYLIPVHPVILLIPINATRVASYELKSNKRS